MRERGINIISSLKFYSKKIYTVIFSTDDAIQVRDDECQDLWVSNPTNAIYLPNDLEALFNLSILPFTYPKMEVMTATTLQGCCMDENF